MLAQEDGKNRLLKAVAEMSKAFALAVPHEDALAIRDDVGFFQAVRSVLTKSLSDEIELWIELGQPDEKRLRRACGRATRVLLYCYNRRSAEVWWQQQRQKLARFDNLAVYFVPDEALQALAQLASRNMQLQCTVQERVIWLGDADHSVQVEPVTWRPGG